MIPNSRFHLLQQAVLRLDLPAGTRILVAVSGGPDSVALLETLRSLASCGGRAWQLRVAHVNHLLRGEESELDEAFVRRLADGQSLDLRVARVDTRAYAGEHRLSIETAAREVRYRELRRMLRDWPGDFIATGHTQDDQAETVLLRLTRGSGLRGLGGMARVGRDMVRPFLGVRHVTILEALQERGQGYRLDASNLDLRHRRNLVRRHVIPALESLQPRIVPVVERTASLLRTDAEYLEQEAVRALNFAQIRAGDDEIVLDRSTWGALHRALRRATVRSALSRLIDGLQDIDEAHISIIEQAIETLPAGHALQSRLPRGLTVHKELGSFTLRRGSRLPPAALETLDLRVPGTARSQAGTAIAEVLGSPEPGELERLVTVCGPLNAICDGERAGDVLRVRSRRPGDRMMPLGAPGSRKLQDLFVDRHVPRELRDQIPVIQNARHIVWIPGIALDDRAAVSGATTRVLHLKWEPADPNYRDTMPRYSFDK